MKYLFLLVFAITSRPVFAQLLSLDTFSHDGMQPIDSQVLQWGKVFMYDNKANQIRFTGNIGLGGELSSGDVFKTLVKGEADIFFKKRLSLHASYAYAFTDRAAAEANNDNYTNKSENEIASPSFVELGGRIFLKQHTHYVKYKIVLESWGGYRTVTYRYIEPRLPAISVLALRGGYYSRSAVVNTDMNEGELKDGKHGAVKAIDGTILANNYYTNAFSRGGYVGIASLRFINTLTKNTYKPGKAIRPKYVRELYADLLFASTTLDPIIERGISHELTTNAAGCFQASPIGGRIGFTSLDRQHKWTIVHKLEAGYRPGIKGTGWYVNAGFAFGLIK